MNNIIVYQQIPRVFDCLYNQEILQSVSLVELRDAFRPSQITSKIWLLDHIKDLLTPELRICVLGSWFGFIASCLFDLGVTKITDIDIDARCADLSIRLNSRNKDYCRLICDASDLDYKNFDMIINTSSEHMSDSWFANVCPGTVIALQTNNIKHLTHVNIKHSLSEVCNTYAMNLIYQGQIDFKTYSRFMAVGIKT